MPPAADVLGLDAESILFLAALVVVGLLVVFRFLIPLIQGYREGERS